MSLMDGGFSLAINHVMSIDSGEENIFMLRVLFVMELFNQGSVLSVVEGSSGP